MRSLIKERNANQRAKFSHTLAKCDSLKALRPQSWRGSHERIRPSPGGRRPETGAFPAARCGPTTAAPIDAGRPLWLLFSGRRTPGGSLLFRTAPRRPKYGDTIIAARLSRRPKRSRTHAGTPLAFRPPAARLCPVSSVPRGSFNDTIRAPLSALRPPAADPRPCGQKRRPRALWRGGRRRAETRRLFVCRRGVSCSCNQQPKGWVTG